MPGKYAGEPEQPLVTRDRTLKMSTLSNMRFVFTGGPGAGKTTVLEALTARGYNCVPETARKLIKSRLDSGLSPRPDPIEFAEDILKADIANYRDLSTIRETSFFDRGIVDALCMLEQCHADSEYKIKELLCKYPYNGTVFFFPLGKQSIIRMVNVIRPTRRLSMCMKA